MSSRYNGADQASVDPPTDRNRGSSFSEFEEDIGAIEAFRGFDKVPRVLVPRFDITPYLCKQKPLPPNRDKQVTNGHSFQEDFQGGFHSVYITDPLRLLSADCKVQVVRHNLDKLKEALITSPRSDISIADETMLSIKCKICKKVYATEKKLLNHQKNKHMIVYKPEPKPQKRVSFSDHIIVHEVKEYHRCRKCTRIFEDYKLLRAHMKQKHKKRKCYICHYCSKNFVDRMFFKVHIKLHCDVCGELFPNKSTFLDHRRNVCRVLKMHKCKTCNSSFYRFMDLKDHSYEHLSTFFICDICKDQFSTKCAVSHHIAFLHSKERPTSMYTMRNLGSERLYLCNFCDESSVEREVMEAHAQTLPDLSNRAMTGYKDFYFCDQCLMKFSTEQDMLQHKWTHFLKTSDNSQVRPKSILTNKNSFEIKTKYSIHEKLPDHFKPSLVLTRLDKNLIINKQTTTQKTDEIKRPRKTLISKHQCPNCGKYYSTNYCLNRHIETQHSDFESLRCKVCEETFVWPSLLQSHKCIRLKIPELPFDDARPEIHFDNLHEITQNGFDDFNIDDSDDYMNTVDFEIPAPVVELTEGTNVFTTDDCVSPLQSLGYKVVMQEVPIEF